MRFYNILVDVVYTLRISFIIVSCHTSHVLTVVLKIILIMTTCDFAEIFLFRAYVIFIDKLATMGNAN